MNYVYLVLFSLLVSIFPSIGYSQEIFENQAAEQLVKGTELVRTSRQSDLPSYLKIKSSENLADDNWKTWLSERLNLSADYNFTLVKTEADQLDYTHIKSQQTYQGIPIELADWIVHIQQGKVVAMNGLLFNDLKVSTTPLLSIDEAIKAAKNYVGAESYKWEIEEEEAHLKWETGDSLASHSPKGELVLVPKAFNIKASNYRLAYKLDIYAHTPISRAYIYVDAQTGEVLAENKLIHHVDTPGTAVTAYSGTQDIIADSFGGGYRLRDGSRGLGIRTFDLNNAYGYGGAVDFVDADNVWNNVNPQQDQYAGDAHWGTEMTYDYFNDVHGRNSIDGAGFALNSYVHFGVNYVNAFWDGSRMTYGDGNSSPYTPLTSLDIAGHEIAHGLTNFTANLIYYGESGALNESFSDIFGTAIEHFARPGDWDWLLSQDIGASFRSLSNPNAYGDPDTYFGDYWASLVGPDNGGVHTNSGVQNFWYYLLVTGGSGVNDNGDAYDLEGIGFDAASAIAYRNLTVYLTSGSDHSDARFYAIQSAIDLYGHCSEEEQETTNAWYAVGVGSQFEHPLTLDFETTLGCYPSGEVSFTDLTTTASGFIDDWSWNFGDGDFSIEENPTHSFDGIGIYPVELVVGNNLGCYDSLTIDVEVVEGPIAAFSYDATCPDSLVNFTNETAFGGIIDIYEWFFEPGFTADEEHPNHAFGEPGTYPVKLISYAENGCVDSITNNITILDGPTANFEFTNVCLGESITFTNLSAIPEGAITDYTWEFGDGESSTDFEPTHTYDSDGTYTVSLIAFSDLGCQHDTTFDITIYPLPEVDFYMEDVCNEEIAEFVNLSTIAPPSTIESSIWNFGDGESSTDFEPTHLYGTDGTYTVALEIFSDHGCSASSFETITIHPLPTVTFIASTVCENEAATTFTADASVSPGSIESWLWNFGDGATSVESDPSHKYASAGTYLVDVTVTSENGCVASATQSVIVHEKPTASFEILNPEICAPDCIMFTDGSATLTGEITNWNWELENGLVADVQHPTFCFDPVTNDQFLDVLLIATNSYGCKDTILTNDAIRINSTPTANFKMDPSTTDILNPQVNFTNLSENGIYYEWTFGDDSPNSNLTHPIHLFPSIAGEYTITLIAENENGFCRSSIQKTIFIKDALVYYVPNAFTPNGDEHNNTFKPIFYAGHDPFDFHLTIYNRNGDIVFESYDPSIGWDGNFGNDGPVADGVYIWMLDFVELESNNRIQEVGHVTLFR